MKISNAVHNDWITFACPKCNNHDYSYGKINGKMQCQNCGSKEMALLDVDEWSAADFLHTVRDERYRPMVNNIYDKFKEMVDRKLLSEKLFVELIRVTTDEILMFLEEDEGC